MNDLSYDNIFSILSYFRIEDFTLTKIFLVSKDFYHVYENSKYLWYLFAKEKFLLSEKFNDKIDYKEYTQKRLNKNVDLLDEFFPDLDEYKRSMFEKYLFFKPILMSDCLGCNHCQKEKYPTFERKKCKEYGHRFCCCCISEKMSKFSSMEVGTNSEYYDVDNDCEGCCFCTKKCKGCCICKKVEKYNSRCGKCHVCLQFEKVPRLKMDFIKGFRRSDIMRVMNHYMKTVRESFDQNRKFLINYFLANKKYKKINNFLKISGVEEKENVLNFKFQLYSLENFKSWDFETKQEYSTDEGDDNLIKVESITNIKIDGTYQTIFQVFISIRKNQYGDFTALEYSFKPLKIEYLKNIYEKEGFKELTKFPKFVSLLQNIFNFTKNNYQSNEFEFNSNFFYFVQDTIEKMFMT